MVLFGKIREDAARPNGSRSDYRQDFRSMKRSNLRGDDFRITSETIHMEVKATIRRRAGVNRHVAGDERSLQERSSESILASSLVGVIARWRLKRRQRYQWAGLLSFEKSLFQDADTLTYVEGNTAGRVESRAARRSCVVEDPAHAEKQHAREPGGLRSASVDTCHVEPRPARKGSGRNAGMDALEESDRAIVLVIQPNNEDPYSAEVGEGSAWTKENIVRVSHEPDTEQEIFRVPGTERCAESSDGKEARTVYGFAPPFDRRFASGQLLRLEAEGCAGSGWRDVERV